MSSIILKGHICCTPEPGEASILPDGYLVIVDGISRGVYPQLPAEYAGLPVKDWGDRLIIPGLVDLHLHAPQVPFCGLGMDLELLPWLEAEAFPEEMRYADAEYADRAYGLFVRRLQRSATTRACIFATRHTDATLRLMKLLESSGLCTFVGKVNMDRSAPDGLREEDAAHSLSETRRWLEASRAFARTKPILTPRFIPSCSDELMAGLGQLQRETGLPVQSHLSENPSEIELVRSLRPDSAFYGDAYDIDGMFGRNVPTVMAHCVHCPPEEAERIRDNGVFVAHCPASNANLASGIAPIRRYLDMGIRVGLGTDVAAGQSLSMIRAVTDAIQVSKLYRRLADPDKRPLAFSESLYLATKGGGAFFGKTGSFEPGYEADAVVLDDSALPSPRPLTIRQRLERLFWLDPEGTGICAKYTAGREIVLA